MKTNLFNYLTAGVNHLDLISWILSWGNYKDRELYSLANSLINFFIGKSLQVDNIELKKENTGILVIVNKEILIYINELTKGKQVKSQTYEGEKANKYYIYLSFKEDLVSDDTINKNYKLVTRGDLLGLLKDYKEKNNILEDYYNYLSKKDKDSSNTLEVKMNNSLNGKTQPEPNYIFDLDMEEEYFLDDIQIINQDLPKGLVKNNIVLLVNIEYEELKEFLKEVESNNVYVFSDENSLYEFKNCLLDSKYFLESGFNMYYIDKITSSKDNEIKILSYFYGLDGIDKSQDQVFFINDRAEDLEKIKPYIDYDTVYILRDEILDKNIEGFNIEFIR